MADEASPPVYNREALAPSFSLPLRCLLGIVGMIAIGTLALWFAHREQDHDPINELGMIRPPPRWTDHDRVTYRSWEADTVVVAVPPAQTSEPGLEYGDRCFVQGSTVMRMKAFYAGDALVEIVRQADFRAEAEDGDCPPGTMFVASEQEALRMRGYWRAYEAQRDRDRALLRSRPPFDAMLR